MAMFILQNYFDGPPHSPSIMAMNGMDRNKSDTVASRDREDSHSVTVNKLNLDKMSDEEKQGQNSQGQEFSVFSLFLVFQLAGLSTTPKKT